MVEVFLVVCPDVEIHVLGADVADGGADGGTVTRGVVGGELSLLVANGIAVSRHPVEASLEGQAVEYACLYGHVVVGIDIVAMSFFVPAVCVVFVHVFAFDSPTS